MNIILTILEIAGSLGLFLYGMKILSDGLQKSAGGSLKKILSLMTSNRLMAVLTGVLITVIIQSSSATTVMVVSFVNASLMNLVQAIGVILGANIGTTVTGWIVALLGFKMDIIALALIAIAIALPLMFSKGIKQRNLSEIFLGFGLLFFGLTYLQESMPNIQDNPEIFTFLKSFEDGSFISMLICVLLGTIITIVVQSSSASMAITITMAFQGWIGLYTACALCLGQNIGTTITAYLASIGASTNARRASWAHILFNIIGTFIAMIFFKPLLLFVNFITPGDILLLSGDELQVALPTFLAMFHTIFNTLNTLIFFGFIPNYSRLIERIVKEKKVYNNKDYHFSYISGTYVDAPEVYALTVQGEISKMAKLTDTMFSSYSSIFDSEKDISTDLANLKDMEDYADQMQEQLTAFCVKMQQESASPTHAQTISQYLRVIDEIESITDNIYSLAKLAEQRISQGLNFGENEQLEVKSLMDLVSQFISFIAKHSDGKITMKDLIYCNNLEESINAQHRTLVERIHSRLTTSSSIPLELMMLEMERYLEHLGDYCINIIECFHKVEKHTPQLESTK